VKTYSDEEMEYSIAKMLIVGVTVSALFVLLGGVLFLRASDAVPDYSHFTAQSISSHGFAGIVRGALRLHGSSLIDLGILLLVATPILRVIYCVVGFARQRDRLYVVISASVLVILMFSLFQGLL
jgi:uncharacterized membrane protein